MVSSMTMIVVVQSETDKPTGWGVEKLTEFNEKSDHFGHMYSEINRSLDPIHIFKFELFKFCSILSS